SCTTSGTRVEAAFFAIFDGHAGSGAALVASRCLHEHIKMDSVSIRCDELVVGALEAAFVDM
ncbi:hypothetical protein TELCIR_23477, partial [Teladorsagia circumcincta]